MDIDEKYQSGCVSLDYGNTGQAFDIFSQIIVNNPQYYPAINKMGVIYAQKGELERARECFIKALEIDNNYAPALVNMGNIFKEEGNLELAKDYYNEATITDVDYYLSYYNLAVLYKEKNNYGLYMKYLKEYKRRYKQYIYIDRIKEKKRLKGKIGLVSSFLVTAGVFLLIMILIKKM